MKLKKLPPVLRFVTLDGRFEIRAFAEKPSDSYLWYWREIPNGSVEKYFNSKREVMADLKKHQ